MNRNLFSIDKSIIVKITKVVLLIFLFLGILIFLVIVGDNHIQLSSEYYYEKLNSDHTITIYTYWIMGFISLCLLHLDRRKTPLIIFNICFAMLIISNIHSIVFIINSKDYRLNLAPIIFSILSTIVLLNIPKHEINNSKKRNITVMLSVYITISMILIFCYEQKFDSIIKIHKIENKKNQTKSDDLVLVPKSSRTNHGQTRCH